MREFLSHYNQKLIDFVSHTWLIGTLFKLNRKNFAGAFYEFTYLFVWSILPFALATLTLYVTQNGDLSDFWSLSLKTVANGELLVFTISMLAPILYLTLHDPESAGPFPHKLPISTTVALIIIVSTALFSLLKANAVSDKEFVFHMSVILTVVALIFRFLALLYHGSRMSRLSEKALRSDQDSFVQDFGRHIGSPLSPTSISSSGADFADQFQQHVEGQK